MSAPITVQRVIEALDAEVAALTRPDAPGLPGPAARCGIVADDLRMLREEIARDGIEGGR
ncbi:MAG TPA: hypothetical protein VGW74_05465 [Propionibacteriaceae bacterium]|nr:hypothetical protein [Propionibacteriaceae bacterium]